MLNLLAFLLFGVVVPLLFAVLALIVLAVVCFVYQSFTKRSASVMARVRQAAMLRASVVARLARFYQMALNEISLKGPPEIVFFLADVTLSIISTWVIFVGLVSCETKIELPICSFACTLFGLTLFYNLCDPWHPDDTEWVTIAFFYKLLTLVALVWSAAGGFLYTVAPPIGLEGIFKYCVGNLPPLSFLVEVFVSASTADSLAKKLKLKLD